MQHRAWEVRGGRESELTEHAEFQLGAQGAAVAACMYARGQELTLDVNEHCGGDEVSAIPLYSALGTSLLKHSPDSGVLE